MLRWSLHFVSLTMYVVPSCHVASLSILFVALFSPIIYWQLIWIKFGLLVQMSRPLVNIKSCICWVILFFPSHDLSASANKGVSHPRDHFHHLWVSVEFWFSGHTVKVVIAGIRSTSSHRVCVLLILALASILPSSIFLFHPNLIYMAIDFNHFYQFGQGNQQCFE